MRILLIDLVSDDCVASATIAARLAGCAEVEACRPAFDDSGPRGNMSGFDLLLLVGDDDAALLKTCRRVAEDSAVPVVVIGPCDGVETAIALMKAGAVDIVVRDERGDWSGRLVEVVSAARVRARPRDRQPYVDEGRRLEQIVDGSSVPTFVIDGSHQVTHWNRACAQLTGIPANEIVGTGEHWKAFYTEARPCLADLVVDGTVGSEIDRYYAGKGYRPSATLPGAYEAEDFFAAFGDGGRWLYFTAAPLRNARGEIIGAVETLQDITEQKRAEAELRRSEERFRLLSITDGMTGLFNARHFVQRLTEEMDRAERYRHPLSLMMMDVDDFKLFNDTWGHVEGDQVLIRLAECVTACLRRTDQAFRYGGEEFVVLLPETRVREALAAAERVRALFRESSFLPEGAPALVHCTASIGVTRFVPGESSRDFVARADRGAYEAKRQGKNRVIRAFPDSGELLD